MRELVCIVCPMGCALQAEQNEQGEVLEVRGNGCPRGVGYAKAELTHPTRTLTTSVRFSNREGLLPVKTAAPISKEKLLPAMQALREVRATAPVRIGDVIVAGLMGEADLVATANVD